MSEIIWSDKKRTMFFGLPISFTKYRLESEKLVVNSGLFCSVEKEVRLYRVVDLSMSQNLIQKCSHIGNIHLTASDSDMSSFTIKNIKEPSKIKEILSEKIENERDRKHITMREFVK